MGATISVNKYEFLDDSICDSEIELLEKLHEYEGLTLEECINKRFPNRKFEIKCFKSATEIETKPLCKYNAMTFTIFPHTPVSQKVIVQRRPKQKFIRYCDVIDDLILHDNTTNVVDLLFYVKVSASKNYENELKNTQPVLETVIISSEAGYAEFCNEPNELCFICKEKTYMQHSESGKVTHLVTCKFGNNFYVPKPFFTPWDGDSIWIERNLFEYYCGECLKKKSVKEVLNEFKINFHKIGYEKANRQTVINERKRIMSVLYN